MGPQGGVIARGGMRQGSCSFCSVPAALGPRPLEGVGDGALEGLVAGLGHRHSTMLSPRVS